MAIRERYQYVVDLITDNASRAVNSFGSNLDTAEQKTGRFQSTLGRAGTFLKENLAAAAATAGAALVEFGRQSFKAFQDASIEAGKFADATGLAVDDASRWVEVAGDVGVSAETVSGLFVRLNKAIGDNAPVVAELGIEQKKLADGTTDVNATMLEAIQRINAIKDPTDRATAAQALFGRGYKESAEIIFGSASRLRGELEGVSDAIAIDDDELTKARLMRQRLDELTDAVEGLKRSFGESIGDIIADLTLVNDSITRLTGGFVEITDAAQGVIAPITAATDILQRMGLLADPLDEVGFAAGRVSEKGGELAETFGEIDDRAEGVATALDNAEAAADREEAQARRNIETTKRLTSEYNDQADQIDDLIGRKAALVGGDIAVRQAQRDAKTAADELNEALEDQSLELSDLAPIIDNATQAQLDAAQAAADYKADQLEANGTLVDAKVRNQLLKDELIALAGTVDGPLRNAILRYIDDLNRIPSSVNTNITQNGTDDRRFGAQSLGPNTSTGGLLASAQSFGSTGVGKQLPPITLNVYPGIGTDGRQVGRQIVEALEAFFRSGGQLPPTMAQRLGG